MQNPYVETLKPVWLTTKDVWVNEQKLQELIRKMKKEQLIIPAWAVPNVQPPIDCDLSFWLNFICWINTVNFAFTNFQPPYNKFTIEYPEGTIWTGAFALSAAFMRALQEGIPVTSAEYMSRISLKDVKYIFRPIDKEHQIPMLRERYEIFHEVGRKLLKLSPYRGDEWFDLFDQGNFRAFNNGKGIVELIVANFPSFRKDFRYYKGYRLEFYKRAQLLVMMYHGRAVNSGGRYPLIKDIEDIGPIADYDVPKALHFLGVLEYSNHLEVSIKNHRVFTPNDPEEVENRLAMSYVMKRICDEVRVNMAQADFYIWHMGKESEDPHMLVVTTDY